MRRHQVPVREPEFKKPENAGGRVSDRVPSGASDVVRGSHVTPVAPPTEPTDPMASMGPLTLPPTWFPSDEFEAAKSVAEPFEQADGVGPTLEALESLDEAGLPRPRDTLPSPPPCLEEYDPGDLAHSKDPSKRS